MVVDDETLGAALAVSADAFRVSPLATIVLDRQLRVRLWNDAAHAMFGYAASEVEGQLWALAAVDPGFGLRSHVQTALAGEMVADIDGSWVTRDARTIRARVSLAPLRAGNDRVAGAVMLFSPPRPRHEDLSLLRSQATLLDLSYDAILVREFASDTIQYWNRGAEELYGFTYQQALGRISHELLGTVHPIPIAEAKAQLLRNGHWEGELTHTASDGRVVIVSSRWKLQMDDEAPASILETNTNITERKRIERELETALHAAEVQRENLHSLFMQAPAAIAILRGEEMVYELANPIYERLIGRPIPPGTVGPAALPELEAQGIWPILRRIRETGEPYVATAYPTEWDHRGSGEMELAYFNWVGLPLRAATGAVEGVMLHIVEVTDQVVAQKELERIVREREAILQQAAEGVLITSPDGRVTFINHTGKRILGVDGFGVPLDQFSSAFHTYRQSGEPYPSEELPLGRAVLLQETVETDDVHIRVPGRPEVVLEANAAPVLDDDGTVLGAVSTFRDVTQQRTLSRQKDDFLAAAAHDLKTPLAAIKGTAQLLLRHLQRSAAPDPDRLGDGLHRVDTTVTRMSRLINDLLDATRSEMDRPLDLQRRRVDLLALVRRIAAEVSPEGRGRHSITVRSNRSAVIGQWDVERIERVAANLLSNAVKYSPDGGQIEVAIEVVSQVGAEDVLISVRDPGIGIPPDDLPHVFDRFYRGRNTGRIAGTGIGLAGVRDIVEQHGGLISVESVEGQGTTFLVHLPVQGSDPGE